MSLLIVRSVRDRPAVRPAHPGPKLRTSGPVPASALPRLPCAKHHSFSAVALLLNVLGFAAAIGVEWVIHFVFVRLDPSEIAALRTGPLGTASVAASMIFLLGSILYFLALLRNGKAPRIPTIAYGIATIPIALHNSSRS